MIYVWLSLTIFAFLVGFGMGYLARVETWRPHKRDGYGV